MSEFSLDQLQLAFAYHVVRDILGADGSVAASERDYLARHFPPELLAESGFVDDTGAFTDRGARAVRRALDVLPVRLNGPAKARLVKTFLAATLADKEFHFTEGNVVIQAAELLGLDMDEIERLLVPAAEG